MSMRDPADPVLIDSLLLGTADDEEAIHTWEALVANPGGASSWWTALERRRRIDRLASVIRGRPWLANAILTIRMAGRRLASAPEWAVRLRPVVSRLAVQLGPAEGDVESVLPLRWGHVELHHVRLGGNVGLDAPDAPEPVAGVYACADTEGSLPSLAWTLEVDESPVLLLAGVGCSAEPGPASIAELLSSATAVAGVVLIEAALASESADL